MKYYIYNAKECREDIWTNPILVKTKSLSKIKQYRTLLKKLSKLEKDIKTELKISNAVMNDEIIQMVMEKDGDEITNSEYNALYTVALYDRQEQRIASYNKTNILKGKLVGNKIVRNL